MDETVPAIPVDAMSSLSVASPGSPQDTGSLAATLEVPDAASPSSDGRINTVTRRERPQTLGSSGSDATQLPSGWRRGVRYASGVARVDPIGFPSAASNASLVAATSGAVCVGSADDGAAVSDASPRTPSEDPRKRRCLGPQSLSSSSGTGTTWSHAIPRAMEVGMDNAPFNPLCVERVEESSHRWNRRLRAPRPAGRARSVLQEPPDAEAADDAAKDLSFAVVPDDLEQVALKQSSLAEEIIVRVES